MTLEAHGFSAVATSTPIVDPMHGSAAGCVTELLGPEAAGVVDEIRSDRDPLFGGHPPEPLAPYLGALIAAVKASTAAINLSLIHI